MTEECSTSRKQRGVFRQPREDTLNESASQSDLNHGSLCKVSDFEISRYSKHNLPDLYTVDGLGRATYWLYKHSLADSNHARTCKTRSTDLEDKSCSSCHYCPTNTSMMGSALKSSKSCFRAKNNRNKAKLAKVRDVLLSSTTSDIEIKETYNSYVNLSDIDMVDLLLNGNDNLSIDKYDNLMMNLELKKLILEKKQMENYRNMCLHNFARKENRRAVIEGCINNLINVSKKIRRNKLMRYRNRKTDNKKASVMCKSTETDFIRTGLELGDLDHILNQMKFFIQSGKFDNTTEEQKNQLEKYLRLVTDESERAFTKKQICRRSIHDRLRTNIEGDRSDLRNITLKTELKQTSSLIVETNSSSIRYDTVSVHSSNTLRKCQACATIDIDDLNKCKASSTIDLNTYSRRSLQCSTVDEANNPHSLPVNASVGQHLATYNEIQSSLTPDSLSEMEIKCEDLRSKKESECPFRTSRPENTNKQRSDETYGLLNLHGSNYGVNQCNPKALEDASNKSMDKFKSVRSFNEWDTFKYLEIKQREKSVKHSEERVSEEPSDPNMCLMQPDNTSYNKETGKMNNGLGISDIGKKLPPYEGTKDDTKPDTFKSKISQSGDRGSNRRAYNISGDKQRSNLKEQLCHNKLKKFTNNNTSSELLDQKNEYVCVKDQTGISSESDNDSHNKKQSSQLPLPTTKIEKNIKSCSFPKPKKVDFHKKNLQLDEKQKQPRRPRSIDRKNNDKRKFSKNDDKFSLSDNCIEYESLKVQEQKLAEEKQKQKIAKENTIQSSEKKKTVVGNVAGEQECKVFVNINAVDKSNVKITSYKKNTTNFDDGQPMKRPIIDQPSVSQELTFDLEPKVQKCKPTTNITACAECKDFINTSHSNSISSCSNHAIRLNNSLIHLDENNIYKTSESDSTENYLKNDVFSRLNRSLLSGESEAECSFNIPIYKKGCEIARLTRPSPSCEYTIKKYVQKINKSTQMFEHVTRNDLYTLQWIHDNLFEININPHTLIIDEKIKEVSEISDLSS